MTQENRELMERAIGIVEGVAWVSGDKESEALMAACEMFDSVMKSEEKE
jgi:hypothetical protein